jgi:hypothetical protein
MYDLCSLLVERLKSVTEDRSLIVYHQFTEIGSPSVLLSHPLLMCWVKICKHYRCQFGIFTNSNSVLWQPALSFCHYPNTSIKWWWIFMRKTGFNHEHSVTLRISSTWESPLINVPTYQLYPLDSIHLTDYCIIIYVTGPVNTAC